MNLNYNTSGSGLTQRDAKNEAAKELLKDNPHLQQTQVTLEDGRNPLAVLHERLPDVTIDTIESGPGMFKVNAVYRNTRFEGIGYNLNLAKRRAAKKLLEVIYLRFEFRRSSFSYFISYLGLSCVLGRSPANKKCLIACR